MAAVQLRRQVKADSVERVRAVVNDVEQDPELADLIATWLATAWEEDEADPPPLNVDNIAAIYAGVTGRFTLALSAGEEPFETVGAPLSRRDFEHTMGRDALEGPIHRTDAPAPHRPSAKRCEPLVV